MMMTFKVSEEDLIETGLESFSSAFLSNHNVPPQKRIHDQPQFDLLEWIFGLAVKLLEC